MRVKTAADIGKMIKAYRLQAKLSQAKLAELAGTTQAWISEAERGKPTAELGLILRTLSALDAQIEIPSPGGSLPPPRNTRSDAFDYPDIDAIADGRGPRTPR